MDILIFYTQKIILPTALQEALAKTLKVPLSSIVIANQLDVADTIFYEDGNKHISIIVEQETLDKGDFKYFFTISANLNWHLVIWEHWDNAKGTLEKTKGLSILKALASSLEIAILTGDFPDKPYHQSDFPFPWLLVKPDKVEAVKVIADLVIDWEETTVAPKILRKK